MPTFVHPTLLWGLPLVALPVLIHLINMFRHRRTEWAAMEFLLASQKKNRTWVLMRQLLLLLLRMAAVAAVVLIVAQPRADSGLSGLLGGGTTHHIVLLDDSYSMSDRFGDTSAIEQAKSVVRRIGEQAARQSRSQVFTLLRFSKAGRPKWGTQPDLQEDRVDSQFTSRLDAALAPIEASELALGPAASLEAIGQLLGEANDRERIVYLLSDFRARHWDDPGDLRTQLTQLNRLGARVEFIQCVGAQRRNLTLDALRPGEGTRAAGVPLFMEVTVTNWGETPAPGVSVLLSADDRALPSLEIEEVPAGRSVTERFSVHFPSPGEHVILAQLPMDCVAADNRRQVVVDFPADLPVLLIDGETDGRDAAYLDAALAPRGPVTTGIRTRLERPRYLSVSPLDAYRTVYLMNVERLDSVAVAALERYVQAGGGVAFFLGPRTDPVAVNDDLYRGGQGLFPLPLTGPQVLALDRLQRSPDLEVEPHPIFQVLAGQRNSFLSMVIVQRYFGVVDPLPEELDPSVEVVARLRNGAPYCVQREFGSGRVVAFLSTLGPTWNSWAPGNPSFPVAMLQLQAYLTRQPAEEIDRAVGDPLELELPASEYGPTVRFVAPSSGAQVATTVDAVPGPDGNLRTELAGTDASGTYRVELARADGSPETRRFALNVDPAEGDLTLVGADELASRLEGVAYRYAEAEAFQYQEEQLAGRDLTMPLLMGLLILLVLEQIAAFRSSCHPPTARATAGQGGRRP